MKEVYTFKGKNVDNLFHCNHMFWSVSRYVFIVVVRSEATSDLVTTVHKDLSYMAE